MGGGIGNVWGSDEKRVLDCSMKEMFDVERKFFCSGLCRGTFLILVAMFLLAGCGGDSFDDVKPKGSATVSGTSFYASQWFCSNCGKEVIRHAYDDNRALEPPPMEGCSKSSSRLHTWNQKRWKQYVWMGKEWKLHHDAK